MSVGKSLLDNFKRKMRIDRSVADEDVCERKQEILDFARKEDECCGEMGVLARLGLKAEDEIVLFHTDGIGECIAGMLEEVLSEKFGLTVRKRSVGDGRDAQRIWEELFNEHVGAVEKDVKVVAVGGFKTMTGVFMMYASSSSLPVFYKHESQNDVVRIDPLPVVWDFQRMLTFSMKKYPLDVNVVRKRREEIVYSEPTLAFIRDEYLKDFLKRNIGIWSNLWMGDLIPETVEHSRNHSRRILDRFSIIWEDLKGKSLNFDTDLFVFHLVASAYLHDIGHTVSRMEAGGKILYLEGFPEVIRAVHNVLSAYEILRNREFLLKGLEDRRVAAISLISLYHRKSWGFSRAGRKSEILSRISDEFLKPLSEDLGFEVDPFPDVPFTENISRVLEGSELEAAKAAAMMLKLLDELDVQADRIVDGYYMRVRFERLLWEVEGIISKLKGQGDPSAEELRDLLEKFRFAKDIIVGADAERMIRTSESLKEALKGIKEKVYEDMWRVIWKSPDDEERRSVSLKVTAVFKLDQFIHFAKHSSVEAVVPRVVGRNVVMDIVPDDTPIDVKRDINEQIEQLRDDFEKLFGLKLRNVR